MSNQLIVICGPTSTGKSALAVKIARKLHGEVISADSRQVYRGLNLLSGKITKSEMRGIPHHLIDIADPKRKFTIVRYCKLASAAINDIISRGKTPILVGGTGFYIDALLHGTIFPEVAPNTKLRKQLATCTTHELVSKLRKLDPRRAATIDIHNKIRLVRAIEIASSIGKVPAQMDRKKRYTYTLRYLDLPDAMLKARIHDRLQLRMRRGMIAEAKKLRRSGVSWKRMYELGLEPRYVALYLQGKISKTEMMEVLEHALWHYAKRQRTWFKKMLPL